MVVILTWLQGALVVVILTWPEEWLSGCVSDMA